MTKITLKPGDYVRTEGMTEEQYHAVAKAFIEAGCDKGEYSDWEECCRLDAFGWANGSHSSPRYLFHGSYAEGRWGSRELTIDQILGTEPDEDGWIEWHGGECPVMKGDVIDVRFRDEDEHCELEVYGHRLSSEHWEHEEDPGDIIAYRIHQPEQEESPMTIEQLLTKANKHAAKAQEHREKASKHEHKVDEHEAKRVGLVEQARQLMPGYTLEISADWERDIEEKPAEDMADPANWKAGDVVECVASSCESVRDRAFVAGNRYTMREDYDGRSSLRVKRDELGDENGYPACYFRWISRPQ